MIKHFDITDKDLADFKKRFPDKDSYARHCCAGISNDCYCMGVTNIEQEVGMNLLAPTVLTEVLEENND